MDIIQDLTFETDSLELFAPMLLAGIKVVGVRHLFVPPAEGDPAEAQYPSHAAAWMMNFLGHAPHAFGYSPPNRPLNPSHYWLVCRLTREPQGHPLERPVPVADAEAAVAAVVDLLRRADTRRFEEQTGEGPFARADGTVGVGYRMHFAPVSSGLVVSLCHIYYSK